MSTVYITKG